MGGLLRLLGRATYGLLTGEPWVRRFTACTGRLLVRAAGICLVAVLVLSIMVERQSSMLFGGEAAAGAPEIDLSADDADGTYVDAPPIGIGDALHQGIVVPDHQVALTFDDGPDPEWTPQILEVLDRHDVRATFFVIGEQVRRHPDIARAIVDAGHEIGNHSMTHNQMGALGSRQRDVQLRISQLTIGDVVDARPTLYRPPYSGSLQYMSEAEIAAAADALAAGFVVVNHQVVPNDWQPGTGATDIVDQVMQRLDGTAGALVTLHDGGGDRAATVAALELLIEQVEAAGYEFTTVGDIVHDVTGRPAMVVPTRWEQLQATVLDVAITAGGGTQTVVAWIAFFFVLLFAARIVAQVVTGLLDRRWHRKAADRPAFRGRVSVLVPAYNEAVGIEASLRSIAASDYPDLEIIVIDDGSTDDTGDIVESLGLDRVRLLRRENGGKAVALNAGIAAARGQVLVMVDGDTLLEPSSVAEVVAPFADPDVGAVSGNPKIGNPTNFLTRLQITEYLVTGSLERRLLAPAGAITTVPGAIGGWRRHAVLSVGGVPVNTLAEDSDLTMALGRAGWKIEFAPKARAYTEAPATLADFRKQRMRWTYGTMQALWKHRRTTSGAGRRYSWATRTYMVLFGYLPAVLGPAVDLLVIGSLLLGNVKVPLIVWGFLSLIGTVSGVIAARLDGDRLWPALLTPIQQLLYRPLMHVIFFASLRRALLGTRQTWGAQNRRGNLVATGDRPVTLDKEIALS